MPDIVDDPAPKDSALAVAFFLPGTPPALIAARLREIADEQKADRVR